MKRTLSRKRKARLMRVAYLSPPHKDQIANSFGRAVLNVERSK